MNKNEYHRLEISAMKVYLFLTAIVYGVAIAYCVITGNLFAATLVGSAAFAITLVTASLFGKSEQKIRESSGRAVV